MLFPTPDLASEDLRVRGEIDDMRRDWRYAIRDTLQTLLIAREGVLAPEFSSIEARLGRPR